MADILLIQPPIQDYYLTKKRTIPYGLMSIAACLEQKGFTVELLDALATTKSKIINTPPEMAYLESFYFREDRSLFSLFHHYRHYGYSFQHVGQLIKQQIQKTPQGSKPFLVGITSLFTPYADMALQTAEIVKKLLPGCRVVLGGHHPTELPHEALESKSVDFIIRGEGEVSMVLLADALQKGIDPIKIPGVCCRKGDNSLNINEPAVMQNLDEYPLPATNLMHAKYYLRGDRPGYTILASRGCPYNCSYCAMGRSPIGVYRQRSVGRIIAEMDQAVQLHNCGFFDFEDENLSHDKKWFASLLKAIIQTFAGNDLELRAMNGLFPPSLDENLLKLMKKAGFKTLNLSLGTTSGHQLRRFNRPDVRTSFDYLLSLADIHELACVGYIIVGAPFQDPVQSMEDLLYLWRNQVLAGISVYYPAPGSSDYEQCQRLNLLPEKESLFRSSALPLDHTTSRLQTVTLLRLGRIVNFMKMMTDQGIPIPDAETCNQSYISPSVDRLAMGHMLLKWFLKDGKIRGVTADGQIYCHATDPKLVEGFIQGFHLGR